jgi:ligand-binding sensor domain-containing protein
MHSTGGLFIRAPKHGAAGRALATTLILPLLVSLLVGCAAVDAADLREVLTDYTVTSWNRKDGLPPGSIWSTAQDADGYLWIATDAGLYRFDGVRFVQWTPLNAKELPPLSVRTVHVSQDRAVWVGYGDLGGITRIEPGDARTYGEQDGLPRGAISVIVEDLKGGLWAGSGRGLFTLSGDRWEKLPENQGLPDGPVLSAYVNERDDMVVGTGVGVFKRPAGSDRFQRL